MSGLVNLPRVAFYPEAPYTSGPDFTELAASAGLILDPWQAWMLDVGLAETEQGTWASFQNTVLVGRQNGKDADIEALCLGWLFITGERLIGISAHEYKTAMENFRRVVALITNTDDLRRQVRKIIQTNGEEGIELLDGRRARWMARSKGAGRGFSFDKLVLNEAYALTGPQVDAILPTMSARPNPQVWMMSSPPLESGTAEPLYTARRAAEAGARGVVYLDWGHGRALDDLGPCRNPRCTHRMGEAGCVLDDKRIWTATNPAYPHRVTEEAILRERAAMDPYGFARERIGCWPPDLSEGFTVISKVQWERLTVDDLLGPDAMLTGTPVLAVDVSPRTAGPVRASLSLAQKRADGRTHLELIMNGPGYSWLVDLVQAFEGVNGKCMVVVDPGGPAAPVAPLLEEAGITVATMTARDVASAFGMIYDAATGESPDDRTVAHLGQSEITLALGGAGKRPIGDGHAWDRRTASVDITPLVSITNALWGQRKGLAPVAPVAPWAVYA